jgi:hypothetical protein
MYYARKSVRKKPRRTEDGIQSKFIARITPMLKADIHVYAIPNGGFRLFNEAVRLKAGGVKRGATDLFFIAPEGVSAWLETKTTASGSRLKDEQEGFRNICMRNRHLWGMYRTVEEGVDQVRAWGFLKPERQPRD